MVTRTARSRLVVAFGLVLLFAVLAGCGGSDDSAGTTTTAGTTSTAAGGSTTTVADDNGTTTTSATASTTTTPPTGSSIPSLSDLGNLDVDPEALFDLIGADTFRQNFSTVVESENPDESGTFTMSYEYVRDPYSVHMTFDIAGGGQDAQTIELITIGSDAWLFEDGTWTQVPAEMVQFLGTVSAVPLAATVLENLPEGTDADYIGTETVNGRSTDHYRVLVDASKLPAEEGVEVDSVTADIYIDKDKQFLVRGEYEVVGTDMSGGAATYTVVVEIFDIGADIAIAPPD